MDPTMSEVPPQRTKAPAPVAAPSRRQASARHRVYDDVCDDGDDAQRSGV